MRQLPMHRTAGEGRTDEDVPPSTEPTWTPHIRRAVSISLFRNNLAAAAALIAPAALGGAAEAQYLAGVLSENGVAVAGLAPPNGICARRSGISHSRRRA